MALSTYRRLTKFSFYWIECFLATIGSPWRAEATAPSTASIAKPSISPYWMSGCIPDGWR